MRERKKLKRLEFEDFYLREIRLSDYKDMFEYGSDIDVVFFLSWGPFKRRRDAKKSIKKVFLTRPKRNLPVGYAIVDKETDKMIGTIDYHTMIDNNTVEIGYALNKNYWGRNIVTMALSAVIKVGFEELGFDKLLIRHAEFNIASKRVIEKNKFIYYERRVREYYNRFTKQFEDILCYKLSKDDYERVK